MNREEQINQAKPILFNTEMVQAILDGRKTQTRRCVVQELPIRECPVGGNHEFCRDDIAGGKYTGYVCTKCGCGVLPNRKGTSWIKPKYNVGDILYVREKCWKNTDGQYRYLADYVVPELMEIAVRRVDKIRPSIHMSKEAARIFLRVTNVRVERLQDITCKDVAAEGIDNVVPDMDSDYLCDYCPLDDKFKGVHCYGGLPIMCEGQHCDTAFDRWEKEFKHEFADLWDSTINKSALLYYGWEANPYVWVYEFERVM